MAVVIMSAFVIANRCRETNQPPRYSVTPMDEIREGFGRIYGLPFQQSEAVIYPLRVL